MDNMPAPLILATGRLHRATCAAAEAGTPHPDAPDIELATAKRCPLCKPSGIRVDAITGGASYRLTPTF